MIPWKLDHFMKVLCGVKTSDESRLRSLILEGVGDAPSFETIQALFDSTKSPRRSTFSKPKAKETHQDIGMIHDFMKGAALEGMALS